MPTPNTGLLKQTLAHIEANPNEWEQEFYRCETGMCFAGWAAQLAGGKWADDPDGSYLVAEPEDPTEERDGDLIDIVFRARRILGLTGKQASKLFAAYNDITDLRRIVAELCAEAGEQS